MRLFSNPARFVLSPLPVSLAVVGRLTGAVPAGGTGINIDPTATNDLPGENVLTTLASGVAHWALIAAVLGVIVGGVMWAFGHFSHNYQQSLNGRKGVIVSGVAALLIGASQQVISFFFTQGQLVHQ
jgi:type IV secretory pathway VirB2 component (pilin)